MYFVFIRVLLALFRALFMVKSLTKSTFPYNMGLYSPNLDEFRDYDPQIYRKSDQK